MATCYDRYQRRYYTCTNRWGNWGRWTALGVILAVAFLFFFCCACISQRRRRKAGRNPYRGTGWTSKLPYGAPPAYTPNNNTNYQPPPGPPAGHGGYYGNSDNNQYGSQNQHGGANQSYFGGRNNDVEMQPPQNVYQNEHNFQPPSGPPPAKHY
ncbi:hypothetical protein LTR70_001510 [Exophiala xenobiotica]|uniref:Vesicular, overexpressed in cancer, prosurvival protein 1 n=1 Tax=Lithohypha guttulata TaxID=1690604 RepID=A0ABR0KH10_9EURO|nr:hypothetical protein LTR24_002800 [Lithohypha guttulata]KAK5327887.1 hypothetical protein LTR70_001510 [Exophiala xenobiotica]